ncbi:hypothetical protein F4861DRAFT_545767 [Xylaria intraflava]|nr:hypothetical protein F4861DRAFT_545767 [Xylaria intraflava]
MAAPASKTIANLNGKWTLNKTLSDSTEPALALQGIGWLLRKAISAATITITAKQYKDENPPHATHIDIEQLASGLKGTAESRTLDWAPREHKDWLFGRVEGRSRFLSLTEAAALVAEGGAARVEGWADSDFLALDWLDGEGERVGPAGEGLMLSFVRADAGWIAAQFWGFQDVGGERRYVRNVTVSKEGKFENFKMVYDWVSE